MTHLNPLKSTQTEFSRNGKWVMVLTWASISLLTAGYLYLPALRKYLSKPVSSQSHSAQSGNFLSSKLTLSDDQLETLDLQTGTTLY